MRGRDTAPLIGNLPDLVINYRDIPVLLISMLSKRLLRYVLQTHKHKSEQTTICQCGSAYRGIVSLLRYQCLFYQLMNTFIALQELPYLFRSAQLSKTRFSQCYSVTPWILPYTRSLHIHRVLYLYGYATDEFF